MKSDNLFTILTSVSFLLVECLGNNLTHENKPIDPSNRIYGGEYANIDDFRYVVHLTYEDDGGSVCTGSIIKPHSVLTAAHCIMNKRCAGINVYTSSWNPDQESTFRGYNCYPHQNFQFAFEYDIGILQTIESLIADGVSMPIPLVQPGTTHPPGEHVIISGWGLKEDGQYPFYLLRADVVIYDWDLCNNEFKSSDECIDNQQCPPQRIPDHGICTKGIGPSSPSGCSGDSGGPAVVNGELYGVLSSAILRDGACVPGSPALYMDVSKFVPWILSVTDSDS